MIDNILIIPPDNLVNSDKIIELAQLIKAKHPETYISIIVTLNSYDFYYNSSLFDGLVIEPKFWLGKMVLPDYEQFNAVLIFKKSLLTYLMSLRARIRNKYVVYRDLELLNMNSVVSNL
ncbi:MAG: hypothetical protein AB7V50_00985 [Vampirovibrionia bacterium]